MAIAQTDIERPHTSETSWADEPCTAESAECTCPEFCERDHEND